LITISHVSQGACRQLPSLQTTAVPWAIPPAPQSLCHHTAAPHLRRPRQPQVPMILIVELVSKKLSSK